MQMKQDGPYLLKTLPINAFINYSLVAGPISGKGGGLLAVRVSICQQNGATRMPDHTCRR